MDMRSRARDEHNLNEAWDPLEACVCVRARAAENHVLTLPPAQAKSPCVCYSNTCSSSIRRFGVPRASACGAAMSQRQVLRQLAEAGQLRLQDFDAAWTVDDYFRDYLRTHLEEPEGTLLPEGQTADSEPIWHGHGYELDDDTFEFPLDLTSRQYFNLHARLHAERDWPHRHRRLHVDEEELLAKELRIPLGQLRAANAKGRMF